MAKKGYVQVYTGDGKGKTTAAAGLALRALGAGLRVYFAQFMKHVISPEIRMLCGTGDRFAHDLFGVGDFVRGKVSESDRNAAQAGLRHCAEVLKSGEWDVVILDELCVACHFDALAVNDVYNALNGRAAHVEVVCTGRRAPQELVARADLVTEMKEIKHYYTQGVGARDGIEQ